MNSFAFISDVFARSLYLHLSTHLSPPPHTHTCPFPHINIITAFTPSPNVRLVHIIHLFTLFSSNTHPHTHLLIGNLHACTHLSPRLSCSAWVYTKWIRAVTLSTCSRSSSPAAGSSWWTVPARPTGKYDVGKMSRVRRK